jgi:hypothetical protein
MQKAGSYLTNEAMHRIDTELNSPPAAQITDEMSGGNRASAQAAVNIIGHVGLLRHREAA